MRRRVVRRLITLHLNSFIHIMSTYPVVKVLDGGEHAEFPGELLAELVLDADGVDDGFLQEAIVQLFNIHDARWVFADNRLTLLPSNRPPDWTSDKAKVWILWRASEAKP